MNLTVEMEHYITTGRCPYCRVAILSSNYLSQNFGALQFAPAMAYGNFASASAILAPVGARVKVTQSPSRSMQCLSCNGTWFFSARVVGIASSPPPKIIGLADLQLGSLSRQAPSPSRQLPRKVDLSGSALVGVTGQSKVERFLFEQRKKYSNNSGSTVTREMSVAHSIRLTVTIESSKLQSRNAQGGVTLAGFATIQGQVQRQLSERYSMTLESTSSVSEENFGHT